MSVLSPPASIDASGKTDVTDALNAWLASIPNGAEARLAGGAVYRCEGTPALVGKTGVTLIGTGALIKATLATRDKLTVKDIAAGKQYPRSARTRAHLRLTACHGVRLVDVGVQGANPWGGQDAGYVAALEAQHAFDVQDCSDVTIEGPVVSDVYGDFLCVGGTAGGTDGVVWVGGTAARNGRQGFSVTNGRDVDISEVRCDAMRRAVLDVEPAVASWLVDGVKFHHNTVGAHRLHFVSGVSSAVGVHDVEVSDNVLSSAADIAMGSLKVRSSDISILRNVAAGSYSNPQGIIQHYTNVDGLTVVGNVQPTGGKDRAMYLVGVTACTGVTVSGNTVPGGAGELHPPTG